ncbi:MULTISPECIES: hypothetical protein [Haloarcula]|uniref:hypothetical protein n=1 Tax=Haloarcula TaxID=2237 RepID=UPI0023E7C01C|nr:hypothetical protein [Halomicroarcula sp. SHR3]
MDDIVDLVRRSLADETYGEFTDRVDAQAAELRRAIAAGEFDNEAFSVGLEVELYAINSVPEPPEPEDEADEDAEDDGAAEAALDDDLSGGDGGSAWDGSLEPQSESGGGGASLEPADETPPPDTGDGEAEAESAGDDSGDDFGPGEGPSLDVDPDSPLAPDDPEDVEPDDPEPAVEAEAEGEDDEPYMDPEEWEGRLTRLPDVVFDGEANKELGLHNAEINTEPNTFDGAGMEVQTTAVEMHTKQARAQAEKHNCELILDAMWTIPPEEGAESYLSAHEERDGVILADNMRQAPRYVALDNEAVQHAGGAIDFAVPGYEGSFPTILFESLATSIQPHLQIPDTDAFPDYYNAAIRTLGPLLALSVNSPFLPADFYPDHTDGEWLCANTDHELRISAFEQSVNTSENPKVRVPRDIDSVEDVVDRVVADDCFGPFLREWLDESERDTLEDDIWEFDHKRGTYWRWLRCVIGGTPVEGASDERSLRIEYRPLPTQPHVKDMIGLQALTVGLIRGLVVADHPVTELPWVEAERSFYAAAADGLAADLSWVTIHGERTTDHEVIFDEIFRFARLGLEEQDLPEARIDEYLDPIEDRYDAGETPSSWKIDRVRSHLDDGLALEDAMTEMQREYFEHCREHHTFAEWVRDET